MTNTKEQQPKQPKQGTIDDAQKSTPKKEQEQGNVAVVKKPIHKMNLQELVKVAPKKAFIAAGGDQEQFVREASFALQMLQGNNYLQDIAMKQPEYLVEAIKTIALTGLTLNPELRMGYLIPRKGKVFFQSSYMGKREIILRAGIVKDVYAKLVYDQDDFDVVEGTEPKLHHKPKPFGKQGDVIGGYWVAIYHDGRRRFGTMSRERMEEIKKRSEAVKAGKGSPWDTDREEMFKKTIINAAFKELPKSGISKDQLQVMEVDGQIDREYMEEWRKQREEKGAFDDDGEPEQITYDEAQVLNDD